MRWKQFLTPVTSLDSTKMQEMLDKTGEEVQLVDVRQPSEYRSSHIPGAQLIPLPTLTKSLDQLDRDKPVVVY
mgnify:CR=1 FL=1